MTTPTATHGSLTARGRIFADKDTVAAVEARIPPDYEVAVQRTSTGWWLVYLHEAGGGRVRPGPVRVSGGLPLRDAALFALEHWGLGTP